MPNILLVSTHLNTKGGISAVVRMLLESPLKEKHCLVHLPTHANGGYWRKFFYMLRAYFMFPIILICRNISIIHIHGGMKSSFLRKSFFLVIGKMLSKKVIFHMHSAMVDEYFQRCRGPKEKIIRFLMDSYDLVIAISDYWAIVLRKYTKTKIVVVYNPVRLPELGRKASQYNGFCYVLTLGEVGVQKGTEDIMKVAALLRNEKVIFKVYGNGDLEKYRAMAKAMGVDGKVEILGWISGDEKENELKNADLYFLPSVHEGLPMSILEAMSYGLPIVSTPVGGIPEAVIDGVNGFLIQPGDITGLTDRLRRLIESSELRQRMGRESLRIAKEKFDLAKVVAQLDLIYQEVLST